MSSGARHRLGWLGEQIAAEHLTRLGFRILERNYHTRWGELDIVAFDGQTLAFCEVKTRTLAAGGGRQAAGGSSPLEAVRSRKQRRVRKMARSWLWARDSRPYARRIRFDAIGITLDRSGRLVAIDHLEGAF